MVNKPHILWLDDAGHHWHLLALQHVLEEKGFKVTFLDFFNEETHRRDFDRLLKFCEAQKPDITIFHMCGFDRQEAQAFHDKVKALGIKTAPFIYPGMCDVQNYDYRIREDFFPSPYTLAKDFLKLISNKPRE